MNVVTLHKNPLGGHEELDAWTRLLKIRVSFIVIKSGKFISDCNADLGKVDEGGDSVGDLVRRVHEKARNKAAHARPGRHFFSVPHRSFLDLI